MTDQKPWVLCRLRGQLIGIPASNTQEMMTIPEVTNIPKTPEYIRGIINLRGLVIALLDLRMKLNMPSLCSERDELIDNLRQRKREHANWVDALEKTVNEGVPFTLARDPHKCLFGTWYDHFKTNNNALNSVLARFAAPHAAIHASAGKVTTLLNSHQQEQAKALIRDLRDTHQKEIFHVFDDMEKMLREAVQEIAVVVEHNDTVLALTVDSVEAVESLKDDSIEKLPSHMDGDNGYIVSMLGRRITDNEAVLIPDLARLTDTMRQLSTGLSSAAAQTEKNSVAAG